LGSNPHLNNSHDWLWDAEEALAVQLWNQLTDGQRRQAHDPQSRPDAFRGVRAEFTGLPVRALTEGQKRLVQRLIDERLGVLAPDWAREFRQALEAQGGVDALVLAYAGDAVRPVAQGGRFAYRLQGQKFRMELWNRHGHLHLILDAQR
jgi:hypothetical protein